MSVRVKIPRVLLVYAASFSLDQCGALALSSSQSLLEPKPCQARDRHSWHMAASLVLPAGCFPLLPICWWPVEGRGVIKAGSPPPCPALLTVVPGIPVT